MQVITTKVMPATNNRQTRMVASCSAANFYTPYDYELSNDGNHAAAAILLIAKLENGFAGWAGEWVSGHANDGTTYWVNATLTVASHRVIVGKDPQA